MIGGGLGVWEAVREKRSWPFASASVLLLSIPAFALGFLLLLLFGYVIPIFPVDGGTGLAHLVLPALALGVLGAPYYANVIRDGVKDALGSSYTRTAVAKGLPKRYIVSPARDPQRGAAGDHHARHGPRDPVLGSGLRGDDLRLARHRLLTDRGVRRRRPAAADRHRDRRGRPGGPRATWPPTSSAPSSTHVGELEGLR